MGNNVLITGLIATVMTFVLTFLAMPKVIQLFREKQLGQTTRDEGPDWHKVKEGTPTMGGVVFIIMAALVTFLFSIIQWLFNPSLLLLLFVLLFFGAIGFVDDYIILFMKRNEGLTSRQKFISQVIGAAIFAVSYQLLNLNTTLTFPLIGETSAGWIHVLFSIFWIVGFSNAVNLTDGIDGLSSSTAIIAFLAYGIIAWQQSQYSIFLFILAIVGGLAAFLVFNKKPARIFMGDVGSLSLGAVLAALSILLKAEFTLLLIGVIFVIETASVILQVTSFKTRGKRLFKMSPIHHHFEMEGWSEEKIVLIFSLVGLLGAGLGLWSYL